MNKGIVIVVIAGIIIGVVIGFFIFNQDKNNGNKIPYGDDGLVQMTLTFSNQINQDANIIAYVDNKEVYNGNLNGSPTNIGGSGGSESKLVNVGGDEFSLKVFSGSYSKNVKIDPVKGIYVYILFFGNTTSSGESFSIQQSIEKLNQID